MKEVIFCNTLNGLQTAVHRMDDKVIAYLVFTCDTHSGEIVNFAGAHPGRFRAAEESTVPHPGKSFQEKFVDFVARVNRNNKSCFWWGLNFTNKNPITTRLCDRTAQFLQIVEQLRCEDAGPLVVVSDDRVLLRQVRIHARSKPITIVDAISRGADLKEIVKRFTPLAVFAAFFRAVIFSICARIYCRVKLSRKHKRTVVMSLLNEQSFTGDGDYRDTYFGDFLAYMQAREIPFMSLLIVTSGNYRNLLGKLRRQAPDLPAAALDRFLGLLALTACLFHCLGKYCAPVRLKGDVSIDGIDLSYLVRTAARNDYRSGRYFDNVRIYHAMRSLSKKLAVDRFYYPFENRSAEKMAITGLRKFSPDTRIIGYQHASLSLRHTNFLLSEDEHKAIPLPDCILTMGKVTRDFMTEAGGFPQELLRTGCALRQRAYTGPLKSQKTVARLLVVLATNIEEYVKVVRFLNEACGGDGPWEIWIRPHPVYSLDEALAITGQPRFSYHKSDGETLGECLDWADVVLYVHSTVSIEALARGMPVVHLNVPNVLNPDPLLSFDDFKWRADVPGDLGRAIEAINELEGDDFIRRQELGVRFTREYFFPVDESSMEAFLIA